MSSDALIALATQLGVGTSYIGFDGKAAVASEQTLHQLTSALARGVGIAMPELGDEAGLWRATASLRIAAANAGVPPVVLGWDGALMEVGFSVRADLNGRWQLAVVSENNNVIRLDGALFDLAPSHHFEYDGQAYCVRSVAFAVGELGYHQLQWSYDNGAHTRSGSSVIICAPTKSYRDETLPDKTWGVFAPLYGLKSPQSGSCGDFGTLRHFADLVVSWGGYWVATLPLLAGYYQNPCSISPYSPASRMFWNELYLDQSQAAAKLGLASRTDSHRSIEQNRLFGDSGINYQAQYQWRRAELERIVEATLASPTHKLVFSQWLGQNPDVLDYAVFRALGEQFASPWSQWPAKWRDQHGFFARLEEVPADVDRKALYFHSVAQWLLATQLADFSATTAAGLYLDLPVGVNRDAYEVWRRRKLFILEASTGAPPDALFLGGQDWGLPPLHPIALRDDHYRYFITCVREHMRYASMLRVDHVMGLFRLYCVPNGNPATAGAYIHYHAEELLAILSLESHRNQCAIVGEDLGTVPPQVPVAMKRHRMLGLHVGQFALPSAHSHEIGVPPASAVASLNTHDTATFGGWWVGNDIDDRFALGLITTEQQQAEHDERASSRRQLRQLVQLNSDAPDLDSTVAIAVFRYLMLSLAASEAPVVLINLEDLWLEPLPQNVPGTSTERNNWLRPMAHNLADLGVDPRRLGFAESHVAAPVEVRWINDLAAVRRS